MTYMTYTVKYCVNGDVLFIDKQPKAGARWPRLDESVVIDGLQYRVFSVVHRPKEVRTNVHMILLHKAPS